MQVGMREKGTTMEQQDFLDDYDIDETGEDVISDDEKLSEAKIVNALLEQEHKPPTKDLEELLVRVQGLRPVFEETIAFCREPRRGAEVDEKHRELTEFNYSTFSPVSIRAMLEEAGALEYIEDENAEAPEVGPVQEDEEGEFYTIAPKPEGFWVATAKGLEAIDSRDRKQETRDLMNREHTFADAYIEVLRLLEESPKTIGEIDEIVCEDAAMKAQRRRGAALVKRLEECRAVEFRGKWEITDTGRAVLADARNRN